MMSSPFMYVKYSAVNVKTPKIVITIICATAVMLFYLIPQKVKPACRPRVPSLIRLTLPELKS